VYKDISYTLHYKKIDIKQFLCTAARWGCKAGTSSFKGTMPAFAIVIITNTEQLSLIF